MPEKTWIKVKRGLLEPKHRDKMGVRVWLYMYMLDVADWETGTINNWKDKEHAKELDMELRTFREWRRQLAEDGYITCVPERTGQKIIIHNYTNPRKYSNEVENPYGEPPGWKKDVTQGVSKDVTPTYKSHNNNKHTLSRSDLFALRSHFSDVSKIPQPKWSDLDSKSRGKYGTWWNKALKAMWINAGCDLEKTKRTITATLKGVDFDVYAPISIEKAFMKYLNHQEKAEIPYG